MQRNGTEWLEFLSCRFDKLLYVGINVRKRDQLKILEAQTKRTNLGNDVSLNVYITLVASVVCETV